MGRETGGHNTSTLLIEKHLGIMMEVLLSGSVVKGKRALSRLLWQPAEESIRRTQMSLLARPASLGNNLQRFSFESWERGGGEVVGWGGGGGGRNIVSELMMETSVSASARAEAIIGNFIIYEFMNCTGIHLSRCHMGDRIGFNCRPALRKRAPRSRSGLG